MHAEQIMTGISFIASALLVGLVLVAWRRRQTHTGQAFFWMMMCGMIWTIGVLLEILTDDLETRVLLTNIQFIGVTFLPLSLLILVLYYTGRAPSRRLIAALAVVPILTNIVIWTNPLHHWFRGQPYFFEDTPFPMAMYDYQWWFYFVNVPVDYLYMLAAFLVALDGIQKMPAVYRRQMIIFIGAMILPMITNVLYIIGYSPLPHFDLSPATFSVSGLLMIWNLYGNAFMDLLPLARDLVFEQMDDGVAILDPRRRILDANPAALRMMEADLGVIGRDIEVVFPLIAEKLAEMTDNGAQKADLSVQRERPLHFEIKRSPIYRMNDQIGEMIAIRDVTERVELYNKVHDLAIHDHLSGVYTRRHFQERLKKSLSYIERNPEFLIAILLVDIDRLKHINDTYGHEAGDKMLQAFARKCRTLIRPMDSIGRWGGDEFIVLLEDVDTDEAAQIAERIRQQTELLKVASPAGPIHITCSIGLAGSSDLRTGEVSAEALFHNADLALYAAKQAGRNRLVLFRDISANGSPD